VNSDFTELIFSLIIGSVFYFVEFTRRYPRNLISVRCFRLSDIPFLTAISCTTVGFRGLVQTTIQRLRLSLPEMDHPPVILSFIGLQVFQWGTQLRRVSL
jgi:hypothetical protein